MRSGEKKQYPLFPVMQQGFGAEGVRLTAGGEYSASGSGGLRQPAVLKGQRCLRFRQFALDAQDLVRERLSSF
jgi:hypothetical protein